MSMTYNAGFSNWPAWEGGFSPGPGDQPARRGGPTGLFFSSCRTRIGDLKGAPNPEADNTRSARWRGE